LIDSVAKKMADDFFKAFQNELSPQEKVNTTATEPSQTPAPQSSTSTAPSPLESSSANASGMVPAWWLFPAALLGATLMLAGARWMH
jgi:hypothetical protein